MVKFFENFILSNRLLQSYHTKFKVTKLKYLRVFLCLDKETRRECDLAKHV